ncbi:MAG: MMPL family transporter, partial [Myxococcota bacterium]
MIDGLEARLGGFLAAWVGGAIRRPSVTIVCMLLGAVAAGFYAAGNLGLRGDTEALFSDDLPHKRAERVYYDAFPTQFENMFIVVDGVTPERAGEAAAQLAQRLAELPDDFRMVFLPGGGAFFEQNAFLYLDTEELSDLADQLAQAQPYLAELSRDGSIRGLASILARGARAVRDGDVEAERLSAMYERTAEALTARLARRDYHLSWAEVLASQEFEGDPKRRVLLVQPALQTADLQPARRSIETLRREIRALDLGPATGVRVRVTGDVALSYEEMGVVKSQATLAGVGSLVCVGVILFAGLRQARLVFAVLLNLIVGLVYTAGFTALAVGHFNMISVAFAVLFIGLGVDFGIHLCVRYRELLGEGEDHVSSLRESARDVGSSLVLCAVTTSIGFFAFVPTEFIGVAELGLISGAGMLISLFCTLTLLPALMSLPPTPRAGAVVHGTRWDGTWIELPVRYPRAVRGVALLLGLVSVFLLPRARFDNNPLNVRDPASESVETLAELLERGATSPWSLNSLAPDVETANALAERLRALPNVERVVTLTDFVPSDQGEKLDIIEEVALFLGPVAEPGGALPEPSVEERVEALRHLEHELGKIDPQALPPDFAATVDLLRSRLSQYLATVEGAPSAGDSLDALEESLLGSLPEQLRILNAALGAGRVTLENLPDALISQMVGDEGQVRIQTFPKADLSDHRALAAFVDAVREIDPGAAGSAGEIVGSGRAVVASLQQAMLSALLAVAVVVFLIWRRLTDTALVLVP